MFQLVQKPNEDSEDLLKNQNTDLQISYSVLLDNLAVHIRKNINYDVPTCINAKILSTFVETIKNKHYNKIKTRSHLIQQLFILHQIACVLQRYNDEELDINYVAFRAKVYYPNIVYILIRLLPLVRKFFQTTIKTVYLETKRKAPGVVQIHVNSFYTDQDVIKTDMLYTFLGNGMKKLNPLLIENVNVFYKQVFRNVINFYFKSELRIHTELESLSSDNVVNDLIYIPTGVAIYRDVMYDLQVKKNYSESPTLNQVKYNFNIFRNVILNNELQNIYLTSQKDTFMLNNDQYKLTHIYRNDIEKKLEKIKKLPTIYRLLKAVHIVSKNKIYNESVIRREMVENAVLEELIFPFKNIFQYENIYEILKKISKNFTDSLLTGEYINLMTLTPIVINQITFINQIRTFIRMCLEANNE